LLDFFACTQRMEDTFVNIMSFISWSAWFLQQDKPEPTHILGVFGLSLYTKEKDLLYEFERYGQIDKMQLIYDARVCYCFGRFWDWNVCVARLGCSPPHQKHSWLAGSHVTGH
jgi:hypothetical protein